MNPIRSFFAQRATEREFKALLDDLARVPLSQHREQMAAVIADARDLIQHGEQGVALESVCQMLYEWDFPLARADYERLQKLGCYYGFESSTWDFLEGSVA